MKKIFVLTWLCLGFGLTAFSQQGYDFLVSRGSIVRKEMTNKINAPVQGTSDLFFKTGDREYFIKLSESKVKATELQAYIDKPVTLGYRVVSGNWDSGGGDLQNPVQSRVGNYIVVLLVKNEP